MRPEMLCIFVKSLALIANPPGSSRVNYLAQPNESIVPEALSFTLAFARPWCVLKLIGNRLGYFRFT